MPETEVSINYCTDSIRKSQIIFVLFHGQLNKGSARKPKLKYVDKVFCISFNPLCFLVSETSNKINKLMSLFAVVMNNVVFLKLDPERIVPVDIRRQER